MAIIIPSAARYQNLAVFQQCSGVISASIEKASGGTSNAALGIVKVRTYTVISSTRHQYFSIKQEGSCVIIYTIIFEWTGIFPCTGGRIVKLSLAGTSKAASNQDLAIG